MSTPWSAEEIKDNYLALKEQIAKDEQKYGREKGSIRLLVASKARSPAAILAVYHLGQRAFGENHVQEALAKMLVLPPDIEWHFIGPIQSNKTRKIAEHFAWVHSVDCIKVAERLSEQRPAHLPPLNICLEVNISEEPTKAGVLASEVYPLAQHCLGLPKLLLRGLMAIPAPFTHFSEQRGEFHKVCMLWKSLREQGIALDTLSIGMSNDIEAAIAEGATMMRIGTAIFGPRDSG